MSVRSGQQGATTVPGGADAGEREVPKPGLRHPVAFLQARDPGLVTDRAIEPWAVVANCWIPGPGDA